jgi:glycerate dehydrogenase
MVDEAALIRALRRLDRRCRLRRHHRRTAAAGASDGRPGTAGAAQFPAHPHVAWASRPAMQALADQLIDNIEAFVAGTPRNRVA